MEHVVLLGPIVFPTTTTTTTKEKHKPEMLLIKGRAAVCI